MTGDELDILPRELEAVFHRLQNRITDDIIRRMRANMGEITRAADWQIYRSAELGASKKELRRIIANTLKLADAEVDRIFDEAKNSGYARAADIYEKTGIDVKSYADNDVLKQLVSSLKAQTLDELQNITGTMGVATANRGKRQILSLTEFYIRTLDDAALDIATGAFDYNAVLKRAVRELTNSGIRHIYYDSVSKRPTTARIEVAARRAIMTGVSQLTGKISEQNAEALGTDMYEVTAHEGCRETHLDWQGKWYSMADLVRVCGYGDVAGLKGANCRHDFYPVIPGVDEPTYTAEELARIREDELTPREYNGKEYTKYQATQRQRELERTMRARRASIKALEDGGADEDDIILERASYRALSQEYTRFSKSMGLREQRERVTIDGLGNVGTGKRKTTKLEEAKIVGHIRRKIKTVLTNDDIISYNGLSAELRRKFEQKLNQNNNDVNRAIINELPKLDVAYTDGICSLNKRHNIVMIRHDIEPEIFAHEIFHEIDVRYKINAKTDLLTPLQRDWDNLIKKSNGDIVGFLISRYPDAFARNKTGRIGIKPQYSGIADILNGISAGGINLGYYHPKSYWNTPGNLQAEAWAQYGAIMFQNDTPSIKMFNELFTNFENCAIMAIREVL